MLGGLMLEKPMIQYFKNLSIIKTPKWISWLKEAMRTWRTLLQEGRVKNLNCQKKLRLWDFSGGFPEPHTILHSVYDCVIYCEKFKTLRCTRTTRNYKYGPLMDDLKIYTAGKTQLEKVMKEVTALFHETWPDLFQQRHSPFTEIRV